MSICIFCKNILSYKNNYSVGICNNHNNKIVFHNSLNLTQFFTKEYILSCYKYETFLTSILEFKPEIIINFPMSVTPESLDYTIEKILKLNAFS